MDFRAGCTLLIRNVVVYWLWEHTNRSQKSERCGYKACSNPCTAEIKHGPCMYRPIPRICQCFWAKRNLTQFSGQWFSRLVQNGTRGNLGGSFPYYRKGKHRRLWARPQLLMTWAKDNKCEWTWFTFSKSCSLTFIILKSKGGGPVCWAYLTEREPHSGCIEASRLNEGREDDALSSDKGGGMGGGEVGGMDK